VQQQQNAGDRAESRSRDQIMQVYWTWLWPRAEDANTPPLCTNAITSRLPSQPYIEI
jgi:hypothetical protein